MKTCEYCGGNEYKDGVCKGCGAKQQTSINNPLIEEMIDALEHGRGAIIRGEYSPRGNIKTLTITWYVSND